MEKGLQTETAEECITAKFKIFTKIRRLKVSVPWQCLKGSPASPGPLAGSHSLSLKRGRHCSQWGPAVFPIHWHSAWTWSCGETWGKGATDQSHVSTLLEVEVAWIKGVLDHLNDGKLCFFHFKACFSFINVLSLCQYSTRLKGFATPIHLDRLSRLRIEIHNSSSYILPLHTIPGSACLMSGDPPHVRE